MLGARIFNAKKLIFTQISKVVANRCRIFRLYAPNSISAGDLPQIPVGSLQTVRTCSDEPLSQHSWH